MPELPTGRLTGWLGTDPHGDQSREVTPSQPRLPAPRQAPIGPQHPCPVQTPAPAGPPTLPQQLSPAAATTRASRTTKTAFMMVLLSGKERDKGRGGGGAIGPTARGFSSPARIRTESWQLQTRCPAPIHPLPIHSHVTQPPRRSPKGLRPQAKARFPEISHLARPTGVCRRIQLPPAALALQRACSAGQLAG